jgi:hypothetical protein
VSPYFFRNSDAKSSEDLTLLSLGVSSFTVSSTTKLTLFYSAKLALLIPSTRDKKIIKTFNI